MVPYLITLIFKSFQVDVTLVRGKKKSVAKITVASLPAKTNFKPFQVAMIGNSGQISKYTHQISGQEEYPLKHSIEKQ